MNRNVVKEAWDRVGGLSAPSKMPCHGYGIPAQACRVGSMLRKVKGSTCEKCYAMKNFYVMPNVKDALQKRLDAVLHSPTWVDDMVTVIAAKEKSGFFRWHDSGDLQSAKHLDDICWIASQLPKIKFWLPTRELAILRDQTRSYYGNEPKNLIVRVSAAMVGMLQKPVDHFTLTSSVMSDRRLVTCPASEQDNKCMDCRKCWDRKVKNVNYKLH